MNWALERPLAATGAALATILVGAFVGLAAVGGPVVAIAATLALAVSVIAFYDLALGVALVTVLTFFEAIPTLGGDITYVKLAGAIVAFSWVILAINRRSDVRLLPFDQPLFTYAVLLFVAWAAASVLWAPSPGVAAQYAGRLLLVVVLMFVTYSAIRTTRDIRLVMWAFVLGAFGTIVYGIVTGISFADRFIGAVANPNDLAAALVPAIVFAAVLAVTSRHWLGRTVAIVALATCLAGLLMTQSRGAFAGLVVGLLAATVIAGALRPYAVVLCLIVAAASITYFFAFSSPLERTRLTNISAEGSSGRADEWRLALRVAADHPLHGVGLDNFRTAQTLYLVDDVSLFQIRTALRREATHNVYLQVLAELGIVGLLLWLGILGGALVIGFRAVRRLAAAGARDAELCGRGLLVAVVASLVLYFFHPALLTKGWGLLIGLLVSLSALASRREAAREDVSPADAPVPPLLVAPDGR